MSGFLIREYIQSLCRVCVNCFIIISGYYGIKLRAKSLWALLLTVICVDVPFAVVMYLLHPSLENIQTILWTDRSWLLYPMLCDVDVSIASA